MATVKFKKLEPVAKIPTYGTEKSAGLDLYALEDCEVPSGVVTAVRTGVAVQLPKGYEAQVRPRSGNSLKFGLTVVNSPGTVDEDYRGEILVLMTKLYGSHQFKAGDRVAQLVVKKVEYHKVVEIEEFDAPATKRGAGGFGHTGA